MNMHTTGPSGWQCHCGAWVNFGASHSCSGAAWAPVPAPQGWKCPNCGSAHAPHIATCPQALPAPPYFGGIGGGGAAGGLGTAIGGCTGQPTQNL